MVVYKFQMLRNGEVKTSSAEYKQVLNRNGNYSFRHIKTLEKGVTCPRFPKVLYKMGYPYGTDTEYYSLDIESKKHFLVDRQMAYTLTCDRLMTQLKDTENILAQIKEELNNGIKSN